MFLLPLSLLLNYLLYDIMIFSKVFLFRMVPANLSKINPPKGTDEFAIRDNWGH
jgi:hypothetical protein